ncbi:MAG: hypothetical protein DLM57_12235 [Pseudonocardiales bacterium]|nr:MAG: hypothetical protein DLM57_12235 [Pseudonocardiales bacterium]
MCVEQFAELLRERVPEAEPLLSENLDIDGKMLLHLLMADLLRLAVEQFHANNGELAARLLDLVDQALRAGDTYVENAVAVSFVEHAGAFKGETLEFLASLVFGADCRTQADASGRDRPV